MTTSWQESEILQDIVDGLNAAIHAKGWDHNQLDPIKFNKLLYLAVDHFDLPITYRWYKYGSDFTPHGKTLDDDVQPTALDDLASPNEPRIEPSDVGDDGQDDLRIPSPAEVKTFYQSEVPEIDRLFEDDTKEYLETFYADYAPDGFKSLYPACAKFQKSLDSVGHSTNPANDVTSNIDTILDELSELGREVMLSQEVEETHEQFQGYADLLKNVLITVSEREDALSPREEEVLRAAVRFFYEKAWKLVALKIAQGRTEGGQKLEWRKTAAQRYLSSLESYDSDLRALRHQCERAGLIADNLLPFTGPVVRESDQAGRAERELEIHREWEGISPGE